MIDKKNTLNCKTESIDKCFGPFVNIVEYTKYSIGKINELPIYINVDDSIIESSKLRTEVFDFIKVSYKIQQGYSDTLKKEKSSYKGNEKDIVTEADIMIESYFREKFKICTPSYTIAGEEDRINVQDKSKIILLDPIDGTSWFVKGEAKYGTVLGVYRNGYNIMSVVLNTKKGIIYYSDLNGFKTYNISQKGTEIIIDENKIDKLEQAEKDNIYLHLNFKGKDKSKNIEIKEKLEIALKKFNSENNTNYKVIFMQTASDTGVKVGRKEVGALLHYGPAPHDIAGNLIYQIHNPDLILTNHLGDSYNYFDHDDLINSYVKYNENKDTDGKKYLYKYPVVMTNDKKLHKLFLDVLKDYEDIFNKKALITK